MLDDARSRSDPDRGDPRSATRASREHLISVLQDIQLEYRYLPRPALDQVAERLGVPLAKVYGVATFYKAFSLTPRGEKVLRVCTGTACHIRGAPLILGELQTRLEDQAGGDDRGPQVQPGGGQLRRGLRPGAGGDGQRRGPRQPLGDAGAAAGQGPQKAAARTRTDGDVHALRQRRGLRQPRGGDQGLPRGRTSAACWSAAAPAVWPAARQRWPRPSTRGWPTCPRASAPSSIWWSSAPAATASARRAPWWC